MTISTPESIIVHNGNGVTLAFAVPFRFLVNTDLTVTLRSTAGIDSTLVLNTNYTLTGADNDKGGTLTMVVAPVVGERLVIERIVRITQETDYPEGGNFPADAHERALDKLTMIAHQLRSRTDRSLRAPIGEVVAELPSAAQRANTIQGYDSQGNPTAAIPTSDSAQNLRIDLANDADPLKSAGLIGWIRNALNAVGRTTHSKISESVSVEDYYYATDLGIINNAVNRALANGHKDILFTSEEQYLFNAPIVVDRSVGTTFRTKGDKTCEFQLNGANDILFDVGNASTVRYGFHLHNMVIKKQNGSTQGSVVRMRNFYNWTCKNTRVFGEYKFWRWLDLYSTGFGKIENNLVAGIRREMGYFRGGAAAFGYIGSTCIQNQFEYNEVDGAHDDTANPQDQGVFLFDDYCEANWLMNTLSYRSRGYLAYFKGSPASLGRNVLNMVINPNHEATLTNSGLVRVGYHAAGIIGGHGWSESNDMPAIQFDAGSVGWDASNMQLAIKGGNGVGVLDNGTDNEWTGLTVKGVETQANLTGVAYKTGATALRSKGSGRAYYLGAAYQNLANDVAALDLDIEYHSINTSTPISGLSGVNNYNIRSIVDVPASAFIAIAPTITVPPGAESLTVIGAGSIGEISSGTYYKQRLTMRLANPGQTVVDINVTFKNIILSAPGSTLTSTGRTNITLEWNGDYWWEVARTS